MPVSNEQTIILLYGSFELKAMSSWKKDDGEYFVMEGRPSLESSFASVETLLKKKMTPTVIADNMAGFLFYKKMVREVRLSYQYLDQTGALCDIGSLIVGVLAKKHKVPVYLYQGTHKNRFLAPVDDLLSFQGQRIAAQWARAYAPLVEWLPKKYITRVVQG